MGERAGTRAGAALAAAALLVSACTSGGGGDTGSAAAPTTASTPSTSAAPVDCALGSDGERTIQVPPVEGGRSEAIERTYDLHLPPDLGADVPASVLLLFHGFSSNKDVIATYTGLASAAPDRGVVLVVPQGLGEPPTWGVLAGLADDEAYALAVLDEVLASPCVDPDRVWLSGHSAGSAFSAVFGCRNADRIAGLGLNAGLAPALCREGTTPDVLITNGTDDIVVPFDGGDQAVGEVAIPLQTIPESSAGWAERAGCESEPTTARPFDDVEVTTWTDCARGDVVLQAVDGGGHAWPGAADLPPPQQTTQSVDGSCVLLDRIVGYEGDTYEHCAGPIAAHVS